MRVRVKRKILIRSTASVYLIVNFSSFVYIMRNEKCSFYIKYIGYLLMFPGIFCDSLQVSCHVVAEI